LLDAKSLRRSVNHEVLIKGLKALSYATLDKHKLKDAFLSTFVEWFLPLY